MSGGLLPGPLIGSLLGGGLATEASEVAASAFGSPFGYGSEASATEASVAVAHRATVGGGGGGDGGGGDSCWSGSRRPQATNHLGRLATEDPTGGRDPLSIIREGERPG